MSEARGTLTAINIKDGEEFEVKFRLKRKQSDLQQIAAMIKQTVVLQIHPPEEQEALPGMDKPQDAPGQLRLMKPVERVIKTEEHWCDNCKRKTQKEQIAKQETGEILWRCTVCGEEDEA